MDSLRAWMVKHRFQEFLPSFTDELGVECVNDLPRVTEADLPGLRMKPIQTRRFVRLVTPPRAGLNRLQVAELARGQDSHLPANAFSEGAAMMHTLSDAHGSRWRHECNHGQVGGPGDRHANSPKESTPEWDCSSSEEEADGTDGEDVDSAVPRRKTTHLSLVQRKSAGEAESRGSGRLRLPTKHSNGAPRTSSLIATLSGTVHATPVLGRTGDCRCRELLASFEAQFTINRRTARENLRRASSDRRQSDYNNAWLGAVFVVRLFDERGNRVVHERCARNHLRVSNWWLAKLHSGAIEMPQLPVRRLAKSQVASSTIYDPLISHIRRPAECLLSTRQFFQSCPLTYVFDIWCPTLHGLTAKPSNRTKVV